MAACLGAHPSLSSCAVSLSRSQSSLLSSVRCKGSCGVLAIKVEPLRIGGERGRGGVVVNSLEGFSSLTDETPVKDTGVKQMVDKQIVDASQEFAEMDVEEAAEKYNLQEQLFTEVDYCQVSRLAYPGNLKMFC